MPTPDPRLITDGRAVWFAEVRHLTDEGPHFHRHQRPDDEGGPYFTTKRGARRWCETTLTALLGSGIAPQDLEAITERGLWFWPLGYRDQREFIEDDPTVSYVGRSDKRRIGFAWVFDGDPEVKPHEHH